MGEEVAKLLPQGLLVEVVRVPCLGLAGMRFVVMSVMQTNTLPDTTCSMRMVIMVGKVEDT